MGSDFSDEYQSHSEAQLEKRPSGGATNLRRGRTISSRSVQTSGEAAPSVAGQYQP
jgi:hypothetical protein